MYSLGLLETLSKALIMVVPIMVNVAFVTLLERKILGYSQIRLGPTKVGLMGVLQPFSDAIKLFLKQFDVNNNSNKYIFLMSPAAMFAVMFSLWLCSPSSQSQSLFSLSMVVFLMILSVGVYPLLLSGWSSNSKYAMLGSLRGVAQTISYEISLSLILMVVGLLSMSLNLCSIESGSSAMVCLVPAVSVLWLVMMIAETNRTPFDFSEGESELVSGFNIEYSSVGFVLIFLAEYASILLFSSLGVSLFLGLELFTPASSLAAVGLTVVWIVLRATFPRYRYDMLMNMAWKSYLPHSLSILIACSSLVVVLQ